MDNTSQSLNDTFLVTVPRRTQPTRAHSNDSISMQLKKSKQQSQSAKKQLDQMMKRLHKLQSTTAKHQKLSALAKTKCLKLYEVKKNKLFNRTVQEESNIRREFIHQQQFQQTQRKRMEEEVMRDMVRSQQAYKRTQARQKILKYKQAINNQLNQTRNNLFESCKKMADGVKRSKSRLAERKRLIQQIILDKGRQNYLSKLKQQFRAIQVYKNKIADLQQQTRQMQQMSQAFAKHSHESQRRTGLTSNMSFFLTQKKSDQKGFKFPSSQK